MNPLSLLTKGQTFRGGKNRPGSYKLMTGGPLPKFGGKKVVAAQPAEPPAPVQPAIPPVPPPPVVRPNIHAPAPIVAQRKVNSATIPDGRPRPDQSERAASNSFPPGGGLSALPERLKNFFKRLVTGATEPLAKRLAVRKKAKAVASVQTELKLEQVTVVRNDLSEDDLEVIAPEGRAKKKTAPEPARPAAIEPEKIESAVTNS